MQLKVGQKVIWSSWNKSRLPVLVLEFLPGASAGFIGLDLHDNKRHAYSLESAFSSDAHWILVEDVVLSEDLID